jgi:serine/threonine protein kinase
MRGSILGIGASCFVSYADKSSVLKGYEIWVDGKRRSYYPRPCEEALSREEAIYTRLGKHPQILRCFGLEEVHSGIHSLRLELAPLGNVRQFIEEHSGDPLPEKTRLQMSLDIATGLSYIHSKQIRHSDFSCRNLFLFEGYRVKIGDFGGSIIEGHEFAETVCEEIQYELPCRGRDFDDRPGIKRELFALGSAIYEIMAWMRPFRDLTDEEVEVRYARDEFPSLDGIAAGQTIWNCWNETYENADEVVILLREQLRALELAKISDRKQ